MSGHRLGPTCHKLRTDAGKPRGSRNSKPQAEERALARVVPSGPVVFSPAQLAQERIRRYQPKILATAPELGTPEPVDLDALSRDLASRWSTGVV